MKVTVATAIRHLFRVTGTSGVMVAFTLLITMGGQGRWNPCPRNHNPHQVLGLQPGLQPGPHRVHPRVPHPGLLRLHRLDLRRGSRSSLRLSPRVSPHHHLHPGFRIFRY